MHPAPYGTCTAQRPHVPTHCYPLTSIFPQAREGTLHFAPGEAYKYVEVRIIDDDMTEPDVHFSIVLTGGRVCAWAHTCGSSVW